MARRKGTGRLFARGNVWYIRWRANGEERTESTGIRLDEPDARNRAEDELMKATDVLRMRDKTARLSVVKAMLQSAEERMKEMLERLNGERERVYVVGELPALFENTPRRIDCSKDMLETYKKYLAAFAVFAGPDCPARNVGFELADSFAAHLAKGRSPGTYNKYLNGLTLAWKTIGPIIGASSNPWESMPRKRLDTRVRRALTDEELERVMAAACGEMRTLITVGAYTGLRMGDACRVKWGNFSNGVLRVVTGKTGAEVAIPVHARLSEAIGERPAVAKDGDFVMPTLADAYGRFGSASVSHRVARLFRRCGIATSVEVEGRRSVGHCGFHSLRHTFVSRCVAAGIPQPVVRAVVGHASAKMTERYTHLKDETILRAFASMK